MLGTMKFFHRKKGYGFVRGDNGTDAYVHFSHINVAEGRILQTGDRVEYSEVADEKGQRAINLKLVS